MEYQNCCCRQLREILYSALQILQQTSYQICSQKLAEWLRLCQQWQNTQLQNCQSWSFWVRWICRLWVWTTTTVCILSAYASYIACIIWATTIIAFWTAAAYSSLLMCNLPICDYGILAAVVVLNGILKINLQNSIQLEFGINTPPNPSIKTGWGQPLFEDTFLGNTLDLTKWRINPSWATQYPFHPGNIINNGTAPKEYYHSNAVIVNNGLKLETSLAPTSFPNFVNWNGVVYNGPWNIDYKTGWIETLMKQRFGYFEIRCKIATSKGMWPAFWLFGSPWPPEIDIFEMYPTKSFNQFESNYHWGVDKDICLPHGSDAKAHNVLNTSNEFHIYACEWDTCYIKWYYDNLLVRLVHKNVKLINVDMSVIVSTGVDDQNGNYRTDGYYPNSFEVDYVRTYRK